MNRYTGALLGFAVPASIFVAILATADHVLMPFVVAMFWLTVAGTYLGKLIGEECE